MNDVKSNRLREVWEREFDEIVKNGHDKIEQMTYSGFVRHFDAVTAKLETLFRSIRTQAEQRVAGEILEEATKRFRCKRCKGSGEIKYKDSCGESMLLECGECDGKGRLVSFKWLKSRYNLTK